MTQQPIYVYDPKMRAEFKQKFPHLDIRAPDGTEPSTVMSKVNSVQQITLPYRRDGKAPVKVELVYEVGMVRWAYANLETSRGRSTVLSHVSAIDPINDIVYRRLEVGLIVGCYQADFYDGRLHGNYVSPDIGASLDALGVPPAWADQKTHFDLFEVTEEHFVLDTIAAPFKGTTGGARQFFLTDLKDRNCYVPACFGRIPPPEASPAED